VDDAVNGRVLGEDIVKGLLVSDVDLVKVGAAAAEELDAVERDLGRVVEAVDDDNVVAVLEESQGGEGADVARATTQGRRGLASCAYHQTVSVRLFLEQRSSKSFGAGQSLLLTQ
jgi:hypothetical protein